MDKYMPKLKPDKNGLGNPDSEILILIDHPDAAGAKSRVPLSGPAWTALQDCLHQADLITNDVFIQALVPNDPKPGRWWKGANTKRPTQDTSLVVERAKTLIQNSDANIILAMGDLSSYLLTGGRKLTEDRGYIFPCSIPGLEDRKIMPVQDVKGMVWSNYLWRFYLASDLQKAGENSLTKSFEYDKRYPEVLTNYEKTVATLKMIELGTVAAGEDLSVDIEVANFQVSNIGLGVGLKGFSIPFINKLWTLEQETHLWLLIAKLLSDAKIPKVGQNFIFDIHFLLMQNSIFVKGPIKDTMMAQSILFPDFLKGLGFLGSIYLNVPSWKQMVHFVGGHIKDES